MFGAVVGRYWGKSESTIEAGHSCTDNQFQVGQNAELRDQGHRITVTGIRHFVLANSAFAHCHNFFS